MATTVNIHEAKTQFSKLVQLALEGEEVIVAKAGKAVIRLTPVRDAHDQSGSWLGSLAGQGFSVPDDFNQMGRAEIEELFYGDPDAELQPELKKKKRRKA